MSATGRRRHTTKQTKTSREPFDYYPTPTWCVHRFLEKAAERLSVGQWIEPAAGNGAIIRSIKDFENGFEKVEWIAIDIQKRFKTTLESFGADVWIGDYTMYTHPGSKAKKAKVCITNPPYKLAEAIIKHAQTQAECVAMLLRINFLASEARRSWLAKDTPDIFVLPNRPSFRGKGSDATEYAWFVWDNKSNGKITILESTPLTERRSSKIIF